MHPAVLLNGPHDAYKRHCGTMSSPRASSPLLIPPPPVTSSASVGPPLPKKPKLEHVVSSDDEATAAGATLTTTKKKKNSKKPQMKYDPDVPMSKEEATVWRREQRRKRNRESAAASRQRQRDRIAELEREVEHWKTATEAVEARVRELEGQKKNHHTTEEGSAPSLLRADTPEPIVSGPVHKPASPTSCTFLDLNTAGDGVNKPSLIPTQQQPPLSSQGHQQPTPPPQQQQLQPLKMISRHAKSRIIHFPSEARAIHTPTHAEERHVHLS